MPFSKKQPSVAYTFVLTINPDDRYTSTGYAITRKAYQNKLNYLLPTDSGFCFVRNRYRKVRIHPGG